MKGRSHHRLQSSDPKDDWVDGSWTVDCVCGVNFDDGEEMVNCDECGVWVHTRCSRYVKGDEIFVCDKCKIKSNRNNSEETELAQLLVELPTKTVRIESSYAANGPPRRPFRLWTDIPIEERVHVQGIPGGDPAMFGGLPSVFTPELWKCTGYVPKKFNFRYREFPCWDEKETDARLDEDDENTVDKGAGVLFSLSKENMLANPVAALVGLRGGDEGGGACEREVCFKEREKWESEHIDATHAQNGSKKERSLIRSVVLHSGKRKKEESGTSSKDRSGKKKARVAEKEVDTKKRGTHSSKAVFTPTSDAKQLEFCEDRGPKFSKAEIQSMKNKNPSENMVREPSSDRYLAVQDNVEKHSVEAISLDMSRQDFPTETGLKEDKVGHRLPVGLEVAPGTIDVVAPSIEHNNAGKCHVKDEGDRMAVDKLDASLKGSDKNLAKPPVEAVPSTEPEVKGNQVQDLNVDMSLRSEKPDFEVKKEVLDESSGSLLNFQSSPHNDVNHPHRSDDKVNDATVSGSQPIDPKAEDVDRSLNAVCDSHTDKAEHLSGDPKLKSNFECTEGSIVMQKSFSEPKHGSGLPEEPSKPGGTAVSCPSMLNQHKIVASAGKSSSVSSATLIPKSSNSDNVKPSDAPLPNPIAKPRISVDCNVNTRKDCSSLDSRDEGRADTPRRTAKEHSKSFVNSVPKPSHSSRIPHDSFSKRTTSESKDIGLSATSKTSLAPNIAATSSCGEPTGLLLHQKATHAHYKSSPSGLPQRGEKMNQTNFPLSSKSNQNHGPSPCPPTVSSSPAALSDEELALLLHQELNSSPRVPRVPRVRHAGSLPQLASPSTTSMLTKRTSSSGGKDHSSVSRRKNKDAPKDGPRSSRELADEAKKMNRVSSSHDQKRHDVEDTPEACSKREGDGSSTMLESGKRNIPTTSATTANSGPSSSTEANDRIVSSKRSSPRNASDDDAGTVGGPVHRTLPGLINEIMTKGRRMSYEELCNAVLPHWHNLRKHNGERYAYSSHSQAVLDCLRNRHEWARLVDRGPKTNSSRKRRKLDAEESEDNEYGKGKSANQVESKSLESQREEFPKGKRKARKRRRLALQGRGIKDIRKRRKSDVITDEDFGTSSNSSEESMFSNDEIQGGGGACPEGSEDTASSDEAGIL